ncbi:MAG: L-threonylcarbamoyladenylate synthase [Vicinamibacterales bacterium]
MTDVLIVDAAHPDAARMAQAADCLRRGGLVAFPTETVYGLGVHALDRAAVARLFVAKGRPANDPLIVHVPSLDAAAPLVASLPRAASALAAAFWPGPLTLVLPRSAAVPDAVTAGLPTVAVRVPAHPVARALVAAAGIPIAAPSANLFSRPSPTSAQHVLHDLGGRIDLIVDGGPTTIGVESTVVDLTAVPPLVLRPGAVTLDMLRAIVPGIRARSDAPVDDTAPQVSPGLLGRHYAPRTPLTLYRGAGAQRRLETDADDMRARGLRVTVLDWPGDLDSVAKRLYAALREADAAGADAILARDVDATGGLADALRDRLRRAAATIVDA